MRNQFDALDCVDEPSDEEGEEIDEVMVDCNTLKTRTITRQKQKRKRKQERRAAKLNLKVHLRAESWVIAKNRNELMVAQVRNETARKIAPLRTVEPSGGQLNSMSAIGEWEEIDMAVDSGATETVLGLACLSTVEMKDGLAKRRWV